jgi:hypothetical protein
MLFDNDLMGSIPSTLGNLSPLSVLVLGGKNLTSSVPGQLYQLIQGNGYL